MFGFYLCKSKGLAKEECSCEYAHRLQEVIKFQIISLFASQTCKIDMQSLPFLH